jgi:hypothetical protein
MAEKKMQEMEDLVTVYKALFFDLPLARTRWGFGIGGEKEVAEVAWKGYDAAVQLSTAFIDNLYRAPLFGEVMARSLDGMLRWQRLSSAVAGAFFPAWSQAIGLPTAAEIQALRAEMQALREELRSQGAGLVVKPKAQGAPAQREAAQTKMRRLVPPRPYGPLPKYSLHQRARDQEGKDAVTAG